MAGTMKAADPPILEQDAVASDRKDIEFSASSRYGIPGIEKKASELLSPPSPAQDSSATGLEKDKQNEQPSGHRVYDPAFYCLRCIEGNEEACEDACKIFREEYDLLQETLKTRCPNSEVRHTPHPPFPFPSGHPLDELWEVFQRFAENEEKLNRAVEDMDSLTMDTQEERMSVSHRGDAAQAAENSSRGCNIRELPSHHQRRAHHHNSH